MNSGHATLTLYIGAPLGKMFQPPRYKVEVVIPVIYGNTDIVRWDIVLTTDNQDQAIRYAKDVTTMFSQIRVVNTEA